MILFAIQLHYCCPSFITLVKEKEWNAKLKWSKFEQKKTLDESNEIPQSAPTGTLFYRCNLIIYKRS